MKRSSHDLPPRIMDRLWLLILVLPLAGGLLACNPAGGSSASLTIYSGRGERLVGRVLDQFTADTGINIRVRYGDTAELAAAIGEEGANSPADVFFAQDAGALGALAQRNILVRLPDPVLARVEPRFRSPQGQWVGVSGRARVIIYNPNSVRQDELPDSVLGLTAPRWRGHVGWAPTNGSFQAFVTGLRVTAGEASTRSWIEGMKANDARSYANNTAIVRAVAEGEIQVGLVNHYYLHAIQKDQGPISARNYHPRQGDIGAMINVSGVGVLASSRNQPGALRLVEYLLGQSAQEYFTRETFEYPLVAGVAQPPEATPLEQIRTPNLDLGNLADLNGTLRLLREAAVL